MMTKTKLPPGWECCRTGLKGVRKWRNKATECWVTDRVDDPDTLHCGVRGVPSKRPRYLYTPEQAMSCIDSECADQADQADQRMRAAMEQEIARLRAWIIHLHGARRNHAGRWVDADGEYLDVLESDLPNTKVSRTAGK